MWANRFRAMIHELELRRVARLAYRIPESRDDDMNSGCPEGFDLEEWFKQLDDPDQE